jgi:hypothetical protein
LRLRGWFGLRLTVAVKETMDASRWTKRAAQPINVIRSPYWALPKSPDMIKIKHDKKTDISKIGPV